MGNQVSPIASRVIAKCGGVKAVAEICGCSISWVHKWTYPKSKSGRGGIVPHDDAEKLLAASKEREFQLTAQDFFESR